MKRCWLALFAVVSLFATGCSVEKARAQDGAKCTSNSDCQFDSECIADNCVAKVDCTDPANALNAFCQIACASSTDCAKGYACDPTQSVCVQASCINDADCTDATKPRCITFQVPAQNFCGCSATPDCSSIRGAICQNNVCTTKPTSGCNGDSDCASSDGRPFCVKPDCVECKKTTDCASGQTCSSNQCVTAKCTANTCANPSPVCDSVTGACVPCNVQGGFKCPNTLVCQADGTCKGATSSACTQQSDCSHNANGVAAPAGDFFACSGTPAKCSDCAGNCDHGFTCDATALSGHSVCVPAGKTCSDASGCPEPEACVNDSCVANCGTKDDCRSTEVCNSNHVCAPAGGCTTSAQCTGGLVCKSGSCANCIDNTDCGSGLICNTTSHTCTAPATGNKNIGDNCSTGADCSSLLCEDLGLGLGPQCASVCQRTDTANTSNDCPLHTLCVTNFINWNIDGVGLCLSPASASLVLNASFTASDFSLKPSQSAAVSDSQCQSNLTDQNFDCTAGCGSTSDCRDPSLPHAFASSVCRSQLVDVGLATAPNGVRACGNGSTDTAAGKECTFADQCSEQACGGFCLKQEVPVPNSPYCTKASDCNVCHSGKCSLSGIACSSSKPCDKNAYACDTFSHSCTVSTVVSTTTACKADSDCGGSNICRSGTCYTTAAVTSQPCQDWFQCPGDEVCSGRCLFHCNNQADCAGSGLNSATNLVCGYWVMQGNSSGQFDGKAWERVCREQMTASGDFDHSHTFGQSCATDTDCSSEVCVNSKCSDMCGRADPGATTCNGIAGYHCSLESRVPWPTANTKVMSVCVPN